jgi:Domain of unknown function (DUF4145)
VARQLVAECTNCSAMVIATEVQHMTYTEGAWTPNWRFSLLTCELCSAPFIVYEEADEAGDSFDDPHWLYPAPPASERDEIPPELRTAMREARACFSAGAYSAAVVMAGRVIEGIAYEHGIEGKSLYDSLKQLAEQGVVDGRFVEWLGHLRGLRNEAAHFSRKTASRRDAEDSMALVEALLTYLFLFRTRFDAFISRER